MNANIDPNVILREMASTMDPRAQMLFSLLVLQDEPDTLSTIIRRMTDDTFATMLGDTVLLGKLPLPVGLAEAVAAVNDAMNSERSRRGLGFLDLGNLSSVFGAATSAAGGGAASGLEGIFGAISPVLGGITSFLSGPVGGLVGTVTGLIRAGQDIELPAFDWQGSTAQQSAAAAARQVWLQVQQSLGIKPDAEPTSVPSSSPKPNPAPQPAAAGVSPTFLVGLAAVVAVLAVTSRK